MMPQGFQCFILQPMTMVAESNEGQRPRTKCEDQLGDAPGEQLEDIGVACHWNREDEVEHACHQRREDEGLEDIPGLRGGRLHEVGVAALAVGRHFRIGLATLEAFHAFVSIHSLGFMPSA